MADLRDNTGRYLFIGFITLVCLALAYFLLQEIPHAQRPTLNQVRTITPTSSTS